MRKYRRHTLPCRSNEDKQLHRAMSCAICVALHQTALREAQPKIIERFNRVIIEKPLPADCVIDSDRLRELNAAISTANSSKSGQPLPGGR